MRPGDGVWRIWLVVALFLILVAMSVAVALHANTPGTSPQPLSVSENENTQASQNSRPEETEKASGEVSGRDKNDKFKYSTSAKWMASKLGVSTVTAYRLSTALNFITIFAAVVLLLRSRLPAFFRNRSQVIRQGLDEARKASEEARQRLSAIESRLAKFESEIATIQSIADGESRAEEERIRAAAEEEKRKIVEAAEQEITAAVSLANLDFKNYAANLAVTLAANGIHLDASTDEALLRSYLGQLGPNGSN
jgi:F-type H+-transporting ATPase subunit b